MSDLVFCYHCHKPHPREEMRLLETKTGKRWRCIKSIEAVSKSSRESRDDYGRRETERNREEARLRARRMADGAKQNQAGSS